MILKNYRKQNIQFEVEAKEDGYVSEIVADEIGTAAMLLVQEEQQKNQKLI